MSHHNFQYGLIEGFYGRPWRWKDRTDCVSFLAAHDYGFYIYAPKSDAYLREKWQADWPAETFGNIRRFADGVRRENLRFGIGLSPFEIYRDFNATAKADLRRKLLSINDLQPDILCLLFDDMKGDNPKLAEIQIRVLDFLGAVTTASTMIICPTYYSFDPVLERFFGRMPDNYLQDLGTMADDAVDFFWTGIQVCSPGYTQSHLDEVTERLKRKPFIWDNYPVNDGAGMAPFLHLRAFENRPHQLAQWSAGHAVNPMNQASLSQIPMKTLAMSYADRESYHPESAFVASARSVCGSALGSCIIEDIALFQDKGLDGLSANEKETLLEKYRAFPSPYAAEIIGWLNGDYSPSAE